MLVPFTFCTKVTPLYFVMQDIGTIRRNWTTKEERMGLPDSSGGFLSELDVDAFRRLFPLQFYESHLVKSTRPDGRSLAKARETSSALG